MEINVFKEEFLRIYNQNLSGRAGASDFLALLSDTDFFTAPASSKYHLARPGSLVEHSVNVYLWLKQLMKDMEPTGVWNIESVTICGLLHDVCKANYYEQGWRNQKTYDEGAVAAAPRNMVKHDQGGDYIWETVPSYSINEQFTYGHGEKSVYLIRKHMELTDEEAQAIRFHMGSWQDGDKVNASAAFKINPLAFWLHVADEAATFRSESKQP